MPARTTRGAADAACTMRLRPQAPRLSPAHPPTSSTKEALPAGRVMSRAAQPPEFNPHGARRPPRRCAKLRLGGLARSGVSPAAVSGGWGDRGPPPPCLQPRCAWPATCWAVGSGRPGGAGTA